MKNKFLNLLLPVLLILGVWSCKKEESRIFLESSNAPTLTASSTSPMVLTKDRESRTAVTFNWTNPNYRFTTGISSQNVTYTLQIDTAGANFTNPLKQEVSISKDLSVSYTVKDLNALLLKMNLQERMPHVMEFRVRASINGSAPVFSNVVKITITPYLDVAVELPADGTLWITGSAVPSGWANPLGSPHDVNQKFTQVSPTLYELTLAMPGGGAYKLIQRQGDWGSQYRMVAGGTWNAGEIKKEDSDPAFPGPPTAGTYKITVDFKTGKYTVVRQ